MDWRQRWRQRLKDDPRLLDELPTIPERLSEQPRPAPSISRRGLIGGLALIAAPFIIRTPGLLMPVRDRTILTARELERQARLGIRDWEIYPPSVKEVRQWRQSLNSYLDRGWHFSWTAEGSNRIHRMAEAEKRYQAMGLL